MPEEYVAAFDVGTTSCKGVLVGRDGSLLGGMDIPLETRYGQQGTGRTVEQDPEQWFKAVAEIAGRWWYSGIDPKDVRLIALSGQMQDCIPVDADGHPVRPAILYSDGRAAKQAARMLETLGEAPIREVTGNHLDGTLTLPKLLWLKENEPDAYERTASCLISAKDFVIRRLTGRNVTDPTSASTAGMMDISSRRWKADWLERFGLDARKLPDLLASDEIAGEVVAEASAATGFAEGTPVLCGIGDAGSTTIGAGATRPGDLYAYAGTTGWVAVTTNRVGPVERGVFHLAHADRGLVIVVAPLLNAGNAHQWALSVFGRGPSGKEGFAELERMMAACDRRQSGVIFLPYLNGERFPVQNPRASGVFIGLTSSTTAADMSCAVLEGVALAMYQVAEWVSRPSAVSAPSDRCKPSQVVLIGGVGQSRLFCQIFADVFGTDVFVPADSQYLPALGCAAAGFVRLGWAQLYESFAEAWLKQQKGERFSPDEALTEVYRRKYAKFTKLYPALEALFDA